jgi:hypothetical protein
MTITELDVINKWKVVTNCDHLSKLKFSPVNPLVFTEHGALMAASILGIWGLGIWGHPIILLSRDNHKVFYII